MGFQLPFPPSTGEFAGFQPSIFLVGGFKPQLDGRKETGVNLGLFYPTKKGVFWNRWKPGMGVLLEVLRTKP